MNWALGAGWFGITVGAFAQPLFRVVHQLAAGGTNTIATLPVMVFTVYGGHTDQGLVLAFQLATQCIHKRTLAQLQDPKADGGQKGCNLFLLLVPEESFLQ